MVDQSLQQKINDMGLYLHKSPLRSGSHQLTVPTDKHQNFVHREIPAINEMTAVRGAQHSTNKAILDQIVVYIHMPTPCTLSKES